MNKASSLLLATTSLLNTFLTSLYDLVLPVSYHLKSITLTCDKPRKPESAWYSCKSSLCTKCPFSLFSKDDQNLSNALKQIDKLKEEIKKQSQVIQELKNK